MRLGEVRIAEDKDFEELVALADQHDGWKVEFSNKSLNVWSRDTNSDTSKMVKVRTTLLDVDAATAYDVLHDEEYWKRWDKSRLESHSAGCLNPNNEICYYAVSCVPPLRNRDMVVLRSWLDTGREYYILSHSVSHQSYPPRQGFVRALSHLAGFVVRPLTPQGCQVHYVTHMSIGGQLPAWLVNKATQIMAPKMLKRFHKACLKYPAWKKRHSPHFKPWLYPEQMPSLRLDIAMCNKNPQDEQQKTEDESDIKEADFDSAAILNDDDD
ncbi:START domain-containing protein 10-like [Amphibalanus amphitrite]|uniref:START domain-containing protein 10-like n=1 Tax=Amphibalanus amphitrite TaxID=1232801 RepID=UPI001C9202F1|nr:START domain-containing protein 10-like [Amphibalanus amphitrite]